MFGFQLLFLPHGKVERKARIILDDSVFRAVYQHINSMASIGLEGDAIANENLTICFPGLRGGLLSAVSTLG